MAAYWETESPVVITTPTNVLRWYSGAAKLHVCRPDWTNKAGETKPGKVVVLDITALKGIPEARQVLEGIAEVLDMR